MEHTTMKVGRIGATIGVMGAALSGAAVMSAPAAGAAPPTTPITNQICQFGPDNTTNCMVLNGAGFHLDDYWSIFAHGSTFFSWDGCVTPVMNIDYADGRTKSFRAPRVCVGGNNQFKKVWYQNVNLGPNLWGAWPQQTCAVFLRDDGAPQAPWVCRPLPI